jgi:hypothetical protein
VLGAAIIPDDPVPFEGYLEVEGKYELGALPLLLGERRLPGLDTDESSKGEARLCVIGDFAGLETADCNIRLIYLCEHKSISREFRR